MNHLAHLLLAGDDGDEVAGALMGDYVRGRIHERLAPGIRLGVRLHRRIDVFTDAHPVTLDSRRRIRPQLRRFAGIVTDLAYDHYLARHWARFSAEPFGEFAERIYTQLLGRRELMPADLRERLPLMIDDDFLRRGFELGDIERALARIGRRLRRAPDLTPAVQDLATADAALEADFLAFFPELQRFVAAQRLELAVGAD